MMDFNEFISWSKDNILDFLDDSYRGASVDINPVLKTGLNYTAMTVRKKNETMVPALNLEEHYKDYIKGNDPERVISEMA